MDDTTVGALFVVVGCILVGFWTLEIQYLEDSGLTWVQTFVICELSNLAYSCLFGFLFQSYQYYYQYHYNYYENEGLNNDNYKGKNSYTKFLFSIFPEFKSSNDYLQWKTLIIRGITLGFTMQFYVIALLYLTAGDCLLLRTMIAAFTLMFVAIIYFKENVTFLVYIAFIFAIGGLILVCQPSFIFTYENSNNGVSALGLLFVFLSAFAQSGNKSLMKYSGKIKLHWLSVLIIGFIMSALLALINLLLVSCYYYLLFTNEGKDDDSFEYIWQNNIWCNLSELDNTVKCVLFLYGITFLGVKSCMVIGFQKGDLARVSIVANSDVPLTYILQDVLLHEHNNYITYIGATVVILSTIIIFWEKHQANTVAENINTDTNINENSSLISNSADSNSPLLDTSVTLKYCEISISDSVGNSNVNVSSLSSHADVIDSICNKQTQPIGTRIN